MSKSIEIEELPKIEYKQIRKEDFKEYFVEDVVEVKTDEKGYIKDFLVKNIDLTKSDTTIINCSIGQGKTSSILEITKKIVSDDTLIPIIIAPYKSLIDEYYSKLENIKGIKIFDYRETEGKRKEDLIKDFKISDVYLFTFNLLLKNPGEHYLKVNDTKSELINLIINYCEVYNKKVVLFFDEIHDAIHNFKEELIFNLLKWKPITFKNIVSSATYNEASKVVIKYLSELTDYKISIFESVRVQNEENLSSLNLVVYDRKDFDIENYELKKIIKQEIGKATKINILTYSKKLAHNISISSITKEIEEVYGKVNLCTTITNNTFKPQKFNLGTNFKTGININDKDSAFFVFLPPKSALNNTPPTYGIFEDGVNSIIQALARVRNKSRIYLILPNKNANIQDISNRGLYKYTFNYDFNSQDTLLREFYDNRHLEVLNEIELVTSGGTKLKPHFLDYEHYKLKYGERFFKVYFDKFGRNLSNYVFWAAENNQFVNCKLSSITRFRLIIDLNNINKSLWEYYIEAFLEDEFFFLSPLEQYESFRNSIFSNDVYFVDDIKKAKPKLTKIEKNRNVKFEKEILKFITKINNRAPYLEDYHGFSYINYVDDLLQYNDLEPHKKEALKNFKITHDENFELDLYNYIRYSIISATNHNPELTPLITENEKLLLTLYKKLYDFKTKFVKDYAIEKNNGKQFLKSDKDFKFNNGDYEEFKNILQELKKNDNILKTLNFMQTGFEELKVYSSLRKVFFDTSQTTLEGSKVYLIKKDLIESQDFHINLFYKEDYLKIIKNSIWKEEELDEISD